MLNHRALTVDAPGALWISSSCCMTSCIIIHQRTRHGVGLGRKQIYYYISSRIANKSKLITEHCFWRAGARLATAIESKTLNSSSLSSLVARRRLWQALFSRCARSERGCPFKRNTNQNESNGTVSKTDLPHALCINDFHSKMTEANSRNA